MKKIFALLVIAILLASCANIDTSAESFNCDSSAVYIVREDASTVVRQEKVVYQTRYSYSDRTWSLYITGNAAVAPVVNSLNSYIDAVNISLDFLYPGVRETGLVLGYSKFTLFDVGDEIYSISGRDSAPQCPETLYGYTNQLSLSNSGRDRNKFSSKVMGDKVYVTITKGKSSVSYSYNQQLLDIALDGELSSIPYPNMITPGPSTAVVIESINHNAQAGVEAISFDLEPGNLEAEAWFNGIIPDLLKLVVYDQFGSKNTSASILGYLPVGQYGATTITVVDGGVQYGEKFFYGVGDINGKKAPLEYVESNVYLAKDIIKGKIFISAP